jgi:hypothetical protein
VIVAGLISAITVAVGAAIAPARAGHCEVTDLVIVSRTTVSPDPGDNGPNVHGPASNPNAAVCAVAPDSDTDTRLLAPGATDVGVRYTNDAGVDHLDGVLDGLGFEQQAITLERHVVDTTGTGDPKGVFVLYDLPGYLMIPAGATAQGSITATVHMPAGNDMSVTFHTANS